jgi:hypothetical protein
MLQSQAPAALNASYLAKELPAMRTTKTSSACLIKHSGKAGVLAAAASYSGRCATEQQLLLLAAGRES